MGMVQKLTPVKDSIIWSLLHRFYQEKGPEAWSKELVPQGSTANCYTADVYAAIAADFLRDCAAQGCAKPPMIIELGGGSGRFAWQFLNRLLRYQFSADEQGPDFTYMLTDAAERNVANWQSKRRFSKLIANGTLQFGQLLVEAEPVIRTASGEALSPADLADRPVIIIANYLFDCIPSDMFRIRDHEIRRVLLGLESETEGFLDQPLTGFEALSETFATRKLDGAPTGHPVIDDILQKYAQREGDFYVTVPEESFRFLESFSHRQAPMMLLAGDLAYSDPKDFDLESPFIFDSYFAHYTNFDMFAELFRARGGKVAFERLKDRDFSCGAFIMPGEGQTMEAMRLTFKSAQDKLREFNPYDAHELSDLIKDTVDEASFRQIFAWIRFSKFDPSVAEACMPMVFTQLQQGHQDPDRPQLFQVYMEAYRSFFPDGSDVSFDVALAQMLLAIQYNEEALELIEGSLEEFGAKPTRLYVKALILLRLKRKGQARKTLKAALKLEPDFGPAIRLMAEHFAKAPAEVAATKAPETPYEHLRVDYTDPEVREKSQAIFAKSGVVLIDNLIQPGLLEELRAAHKEAVENWQNAGLGKPNNVGDKRFTVPIRMKAPFNNPALFANPVLMDLLTKAMGDKPILNAFGAVVTRKNARMQHVHREHPLLFADDAVNVVLPTYATTTLIPLIDLDKEAGGTQLWENTHRTETDYQWQGDPLEIYTRAGSALTFDYRLYHGGMPCKASHNRPLVFLSYSLPWFKDTLAFESHAAIGISPSELEQVPEEHRDIFRFARKLEE